MNYNPRGGKAEGAYGEVADRPLRADEYHLKRSLPGYKEKSDAMLKVLEENLPEAEFTKPIVGMLIMLFLPEGADGMAFASELMEKKEVVVVPGKPFRTEAEKTQ